MVDQFRSEGRSKRSTSRTRLSAELEYGTDVDEETFSTGPASEVSFKLKWETLRSYTLDIMDGPVLGMYKWLPRKYQSLQMRTSNSSTRETNSGHSPSNDLVPREKMLLWMDQMKNGIDVIKMTFGPEWMRIWLLTEYGRALNARSHLERQLKAHIGKVAATIPVARKVGHFYQDPTTTPIPLLTMRSNALSSKENIFGAFVREHSPRTNRPRAYSMPQMDSAYFDVPSSSVKPESANKSSPDIPTKRKIASTNVGQSLDTSALPKSKKPMPRNESDDLQENHEHFSFDATRKGRTTPSVLENILRQQDLDGQGITKAVTTEVSLLLWLMMEVGNAWTCMALHLLSNDKNACDLVQDEIRALETEHGESQLFKEEVLTKMKYLDALLYESIRLIPANLGGLKVTSETVTFDDIEIQIPKGSNIIFCQPTLDGFDIRAAVGKKPELMGKKYPTVEL